MVIQGERIKLIPISDEHTEDIVKWRNNARNNFIYRELFTVESHTNWLNQVVRTGKAAQFVISTEDEGDIGSVFLRDIDMINKKAEYGIFIGDDSVRGKGYGSEAAKLITSYGFEQLGLHKIMLRVFAFNKQAIRSYEKAGFIQEGYLKDEVFVDDQFYDIILMAMLRSSEDE